MKKGFTIFTSMILIALSGNNSAAQDTIYARNIDKYLTMDGKQLVIKYDLPYSDTTQLFDIVVRIFYNNKEMEPKSSSLTGSWGENVKPGVEKIILWDFPNEISGSINKVTIGVVARKIIRPTASFDAVILTKKPPFDVKFDNKSKEADLYSWIFGDPKSGESNKSNLGNAEHKYKSPGKYNVELTATNSKSRMSNTFAKMISLGQSNQQEIQKHKKLRTIWAGSAVLTAGVGTFGLMQYYKWDDKYRKEGDPGFKTKSSTYWGVGIAAFIASGISVSEVIIQSVKIRKAEKSLSLNVIPLDNGGIVKLAWSF